MEEDNLVPGIGGEILEVQRGEIPQTFEIRHNTDHVNEVVIHAGATAIANVENLFQEEVRGTLTDTRNYIPDSEVPHYITATDLYTWGTVDNIADVGIINLPPRNGRRQQEEEIQRLRDIARESGLLPIDAVEENEVQPTTTLRNDGLFEALPITGYYQWSDARIAIPHSTKEELKTLLNEMREQNDIALEVYDRLVDKINSF